MALTRKRQAWLEEYFKCWNATEAARRVGYAHPNAQGPRLLLDVGIQDEITRRLEELKMDADEVLTRLTDQARGSIEDFIDLKEGIRDPYIDLHKAKEKGLLHIIKKLKYNADGKIEIELYDSQAALALLGKHHMLFVDRHELTGAGGGPVEQRLVILPSKSDEP